MTKTFLMFFRSQSLAARRQIPNSKKTKNLLQKAVSKILFKACDGIRYPLHHDQPEFGVHRHRLLRSLPTGVLGCSFRDALLCSGSVCWDALLYSGSVLGCFFVFWECVLGCFFVFWECVGMFLCILAGALTPAWRVVYLLCKSQP